MGKLKIDGLSRTKYFVEQAEEGYWTYLQRSAGHLPQEPLHKTLNWILEQLNLGNSEIVVDSQGDVVCMTIDSEALEGRQLSEEDAVGATERRIQAVYIAGLLAGSREGGIMPRLAYVSQMASRQACDDTRRNTEFYYAFELNKILARVNKKTFDLEAPPIGGIASNGVINYLRESTRCWLYGFHGACAALCRACLEQALKERLQVDETLDPLIQEAHGAGVLDDQGVALAHVVRKTGNKFMHGSAITDRESRESLDALRGVVEHLFQP